MSLTMDQIHRIREMFYQQGKNISVIASETGLNWKTVSKYVDKVDFSPSVPQPKSEKQHESILNPFKPTIDKWLEGDKRAPRKQRHTAKRVFRRLQEEENFAGSYRLVAEYVSKRKAELQLSRDKEGHLPLVHRPGEAQVDFGYADFIENGTLHKEAKYLVLSFPYSNAAYLQLNYGENMECLLEGLRTMFEYIGGVPPEIWFDNTRTIVTEIIQGGGRNITERFQLFCEHYRFKPVFMNPQSGWEKGNVESKVGYLRRNELVPIPDFKSLEEENKYLLGRCDLDMQREHYDDSRHTIYELFQNDKAQLIPLPSMPFDTSQYAVVQTDKYGRFTLEHGKHRYSVSPDYFNSPVHLRITSKEIIVMDKDLKEIVRHKRLYGDEQESMDWVPYLKYISRKPRSLRNSGIYEMLPESMRNYMDNCKNSDRGQTLKVLAELTERTGFESAVNTVNEAIRFQANDPDSLQNLYRRTYNDVPLLPPLKTEDPILQQVVVFRNDLAELDTILHKGGRRNG